MADLETTGTTQLLEYLAKAGPVGFLFAHYDDAVFSASLAEHASSAPSVDMVLCTAIPSGGSWRSVVSASKLRRVVGYVRGRRAHTTWDRQCGFQEPRQALIHRANEHRAACTLLGADTADLGGLDSQYGSMSAKDEKRCRQEALDMVNERGIRVIVTHPPDAEHPDHRRASRIARWVSEQARADMIVVCDRPYAVCTVATCANSTATQGMTSFRVCLRGTDWELKRKAVQCYSSQISALEKSFSHSWTDAEYLAVECYHRIPTAS
jgi:LmbE family N-acetylglucosaminyl deacetylase